MCTPQPNPYTTINFLNKYCVPNVADLPIAQQEAYNNVIGGLGLDDLNQWIDDTLSCPNVYYICVASTLILIWLWNLLLRAFAEVLAWISIFVVGLGLLASGFLVRDYGIQNYPDDL